MNYVDGYLVPVKTANREAYRAMAEVASQVFIDHGAVHVAECWGDDMMRGKHTDFFMAVQAEENENVVFSWISWPDKETRDRGNQAAMADPRFDEMQVEAVFDPLRIVFSGFQTIVDHKA